MAFAVSSRVRYVPSCRKHVALDNAVVCWPTLALHMLRRRHRAVGRPHPARSPLLVHPSHMPSHRYFSSSTSLNLLCTNRSMGYLKDVVLPRLLDDATFATLSSLMLFNNIEVGLWGGRGHAVVAGWPVGWVLCLDGRVAGFKGGHSECFVPGTWLCVAAATSICAATHSACPLICAACSQKGWLRYMCCGCARYCWHSRFC